MSLLKIDFSQLKKLEHSPEINDSIEVQKNFSETEYLRLCLTRFFSDIKDDRSSFFDLPVNSTWGQEIKETQGQLAKNLPRITAFLHIGIGGSGLGPQTIIDAIGADDAPDFYFIDNIDPDAIARTLSRINPETTLVYAVTKSGTTFETVAALCIVYEWFRAKLGESDARKHLVFCTDPVQGDLRKLASAWNIPTFQIPKNLGGRFSVLSSVGLFPAMVAGVNCDELLRGAAEQRSYMLSAWNKEEIPLIADLASRILGHYNAQRPLTVLMPYSQKLKTFAAWFTQLWAESLGKDGKGLTPIQAVGATDQHSILQLLRDGPDDKVLGFLEVQGFQNITEIKWNGPTLSSFDELNGVTLNQLMESEFMATRQVLSSAGRPQFTITMPKLNAHSLGQLFFFFETLTALTGYILGVNPYDQPGVEEGKVLTRQRIKACKKEAIL